MEEQQNKSTIIDSLANGFSKIIRVVKKNGVVVSTYCVLLFIILYSVVINPINVENVIKEIKINDGKAHTESIDKRLLADQMIKPIIENIRLKYNLDRVCILETHNSTENLSDISFLYMSLTYEDYNDNDSTMYPIGDEYQRQRTGDYYDIFKELKQNGFVYISDLQNYKGDLGRRLSKKLIKNGANSVFIVPILQEGRIKVMIVMTSKEKEIDIKNIGKNISTYVEKIRNLVVT